MSRVSAAKRTFGSVVQVGERGGRLGRERRVMVAIVGLDHRDGMTYRMIALGYRCRATVSLQEQRRDAMGFCRNVRAVSKRV